MRAIKRLGLVIAGMLLWSLLWHGYWFAVSHTPEPEPKTVCAWSKCEA